MSTAPKERLLGYHRIHVGHGRGKSPAILREDGMIDGVDCYCAHSLEHAPRRLRRRFARQIARYIARSRKGGMFKAAVEAVDWKKDPSYRWITVHPHDQDVAAPTGRRDDRPALELAGAVYPLSIRHVGISSPGRRQSPAHEYQYTRNACYV